MISQENFVSPGLVSLGMLSTAVATALNIRLIQL